VVGQATAIGISAGGISATQLKEMKDRQLATKAQLETRSTTSITTDQLSGDLLVSVIWGWFSLAESHNRMIQEAAKMIEIPSLSYGLFHAVAQPVYSWGVVRKVSFPGVNMDIGHIRNISWSKDNESKKWIAYNRIRGQYMSSLEHAIPERFFNDPSKCNLNGTTTPIAGLPTCSQGISAVKAISLAAAQGQKIYTITPELYANNPDIVNSNLAAHSYSTKQAIQNALDIGNEVTIHEAPITQSGWTGAGYTTIDPQTGAGGYIIDGGSNGAWLTIIISALAGLVDALTQKLRNPNSVNGPLNELSRSYWINLISKFATIVVFIDSINSIVKDDGLSEPKKIAQIIFTLAFSVAAIEGAAALGLFFASPIVGAILAISLAVALAYFLLELNAAIAEL
jgi:hypothetical protein